MKKTNYRISADEISSITENYVKPQIKPEEPAPGSFPTVMVPPPMSPAERLTSLIKAYREASSAMKSATGVELLAAFRDMFTANPQVKAMLWTQYTPHFNDGDPCTFGVHYEQPCRSYLSPSVENWEWIAGRAPTNEEVLASLAGIPVTLEKDEDEYDNRGRRHRDNSSDYLNAYEFSDPGLRIKDYEYVENPEPRRPGDHMWSSYIRKEIECDPAAVTQCRAAVDFLAGLPEELLENVLGDGVKVFVWAGGIATDTYDHD